MKNEIWRDIPGYENLYKVSSFGRVCSLDRVCNKGRKIKGAVLKPSLSSNYYKVMFSKVGIKKTFRVHILVAMGFLGHVIGNGTAGLVVDHIDNNPINNRLDNLQIITNRENLSKDKKGGSSKYVGVSWAKANSKWKSAIRYKDKRIYLGYYTTEEEAHEAYQTALRRIDQGLPAKD
jgi:hypothetical protein